MEPRYGPCEASALKYRMKKAVALLGEVEVEKLLQEEGKIEATPSPPPPLQSHLFDSRP